MSTIEPPDGSASRLPAAPVSAPVASSPVQTVPRRDARTGRWPKGVSGNPKGESRTTRGLRELARRYGDEAFSLLVKQVRAGLNSPADLKVSQLAQAAAVQILDRGYGKPERSEAEALIGSTVRHVVEYVPWREEDRGDRKGLSGNGATIPALPGAPPSPRLEPVRDLVQARNEDKAGFLVR